MNITEILPDLWIGNKFSIENNYFLKEKNIKSIINCTKDLEFNHKYKYIDNIRISIDDNHNSIENNTILYDNLHGIINYIHNKLNHNDAILIYCDTCKQRSVAIVAAYIIKYGKVSLDQSINYIKSKRSECFIPNINFYEALHKFENNQ